jgi:hypothetical protein
MKRTELLAGLSILFSDKLYFSVSYHLQGNAPVKCLLYAFHSLRLSYGIISTLGRFKKIKHVEVHKFDQKKLG